MVSAMSPLEARGRRRLLRGGGGVAAAAVVAALGAVGIVRSALAQQPASPPRPRPAARGTGTGTGRGAPTATTAGDPTGGDPLGSMQWPSMRAEFLGGAPVRFDDRVRVMVPTYAEDALNVPVTVDASGVDGVVSVMVLVDRNPIRKVLEFFPEGARPVLSFRFRLEQSSPVRAAVRLRDGSWAVGHAMVDAAGGGCTVPGATRADGSWSSTLNQVQARIFEGPQSGGTRLRLRIMHPMDTGLVSGVPAFHIERLVLADADGWPWMRLDVHEPVSENPVFSFDLPPAARAPLSLTGTDNNGNRVAARIAR